MGKGVTRTIPLSEEKLLLSLGFPLYTIDIDKCMHFSGYNMMK